MFTDNILLEQITSNSFLQIPTTLNIEDQRKLITKKNNSMRVEIEDQLLHISNNS